MMKDKWVRFIYIAAGLYDLILGIGFLFFSNEIFAFYGVELPNHMAYLQFPALLLLVFSLMFFRIASDPVRYRELILYGIGLKVSYSAVVFWHDITASIPSMWLPWAWIDLIFLILFIMSWRSLSKQVQVS